MTKEKQKKGLTDKEAEKALDQHGLNELREERKYVGLRVFLRQFADFIVWILIVASAISYGIGEKINFWAINFIIAFVVLMGFLQEYKAERAVEALKEMSRPKSTVIRNGRQKKIASKYIVPNDLLSLEMGDRIPADAEITEETNLKVDESMLTGESEIVEKKKGDMIYSGTRVVYGRCEAVVKTTGMETKIGGIATMIQEKEEATPLQERLDQLGKWLAMIALGASIIIMGLGILKGASITEMLIVALALAVAAVPEGLPLTMTLALSFGMHRMAKKKSLVRRMMAVETLGSTTAICSDKTGTLTQNEMTVQKVYLNGPVIRVTGVGYKPKGEFHINGDDYEPSNQFEDLLRAAALCNNAELTHQSRKWEENGEPTELALLTLAAKAGITKEELEKKYSREEEILFSSERKMMTTIHKHKNQHFVFSKGAPEEILDHCEYWMVDGKRKKLTGDDKKAIERIAHQFARKALRVLAVAQKVSKGKKIPQKNVEKNLVLLGIVGMKDPPRPEVKEAIKTCNKAGITSYMITGDHEQTAFAIARQIGMVETGDTSQAITGRTMDELSDKELTKRLKSIRVFARTHPEHKMRLISLLKKQGHIVAMTGDGVNDAPALKKADIGIAMGIKGTDVTKESAEMILEDDNFATIVTAVQEGRRIYQNIEKFTTYLISRNFTEVILIFLGILFFDFDLLPLLALQILLINAFAEEMPAISLGLDQAHGDIMSTPPREPDEAILNRYNTFIVFSLATFMTLVAFIIFITQEPENNIEKARTMVFATIVGMVIFNTYNFRSIRLPSLSIGIFSNHLINFAVLTISIIMLIVMYVPFTQKIFGLVALSPMDWVICVLAAFSTSVYMEIVKWSRQKLITNNNKGGNRIKKSS